MRHKLVTAPTEEPVTLEMAKNHMRVDEDVTDDDVLIQWYITAARQWCESFRRQSFLTQTWDGYLDSFPSIFTLSRGPVQSVTGVYYTPDGGAETEVDSSNYVTDLISPPARILLATDGEWPNDTLTPVNGVKVRYVTGAASVSAVKENVKGAILLIATHLYENRSDVEVGQGITALQVPMGAKALLWPERVMKF